MSSLFGLAGRSALVVGGGQGIGRATVLLLARLGARNGFGLCIGGPRTKEDTGDPDPEGEAAP